MTREAYISFGEYVRSTPGAVLLFVLRDARGKELERQVVTYEQLGMSDSKSYTAKFIVDELLSAKMIPGSYTLYMYVGLPRAGAKTNLTPADYTFDKCLTEQGIQIRVRGGLNDPVTGVDLNG